MGADYSDQLSLIQLSPYIWSVVFKNLHVAEIGPKGYPGSMNVLHYCAASATLSPEEMEVVKEWAMERVAVIDLTLRILK